MKFRQGPLARLSRQRPNHHAADYFKLLIGKGIAGQGIRREKGAEHRPISVGVEVAVRP